MGAGVSDQEMVREMLRYCGESPDREGLQDTPARVLRAWKEMTSGYGVDPGEVLKCFSDGAEGVDELVFQGAIEFWSLCEHHILPFFGVAHIGYIPSGRIVGLSKFARLVEVFARRLTVQERMCQQIADALVTHLDPKGVGVVLQCRHSCMEARGVKKHRSVTTTTALRLAFKDHTAARDEFLAMVRTASEAHW